MDKEQAYKIGLAFKLGMIYAKGKAHARKLTTDKAEWITVHPNGKENKGRPALIDSTTGQVLGGMGGKFNGKTMSQVKVSSKKDGGSSLENKKATSKKADVSKIAEAKFEGGVNSWRTEAPKKELNKFLNKYQDKLSDEDVKTISDKVVELQKTFDKYKDVDLDSDDNGYRELNDARYKLSRALLDTKEKIGAKEFDKRESEISNKYGSESFKEFDKPNKPNTYSADDPKWGTEPGEYTVYRSGSLKNRRNMVFSANTYEGAEPYSSFDDPGMPDRFNVSSYTVKVNKPYSARNLREAYVNLFHKTPPELTAKNWSRIDAQVANEAMRKGFDAITYTEPAPPAKREMLVLGPATKQMEKTSQKIPNSIKAKVVESLDE